MRSIVFRDREDAGERLAARLCEVTLTDPLVLAIPRGGVEVAAPIARALGAELDVVLSRKLRAPSQPELALGAVAEGGEIYLNHAVLELINESGRALETEKRKQVEEIARAAHLFRAVRPRASVVGRSVIVCDDGVATGSTMLAALRTLRAEGPLETIVAVPVGSPDRLDEIRDECDRLVCLNETDLLWAVGQAYRRFDSVDDERVVEILREFSEHPSDGGPDGATTAAAPEHTA